LLRRMTSLGLCQTALVNLNPSSIAPLAWSKD
jgi:hypothetical protein